eukprot:10982699-Lingulodinium_polyedra.AAC.1
MASFIFALEALFFGFWISGQYSVTKCGLFFGEFEVEVVQQVDVRGLLYRPIPELQWEAGVGEVGRGPLFDNADESFSPS